jgi:outer membrane protein assembly factor BamB
MTIRKLSLILGVLVPTTLGADWKQFRGTDLTGVAAGQAVPARFGAGENVAWNAPLPGKGPSSPVVAGGRVFVTAAGGPRKDHLYVLAFDAQSGQKLWQRTIWGTGPTAAHPKTSMAAPTPATDGRHVVALFATNDFACLDADGQVLWMRALHEEYPGATDGRGLASSPVLAGDTVVVHCENQNVSFAAGIDVRTGANRWRVDRPRELCWTTPLLLPGRTPADALVLLQGSTRLTAVEPATGREVWNVERASHPIASCTLAGTNLFVPNEKGMAAYELAADGTAPRLLWEQAKLAPDMASPVVLDGRVYALRGEILASADAKTGEIRGQLRLKGSFSASLVAAAGLLYCVNEAGVVHVVRPNDKDGEVVSRNDLGETTLATPGIADGALYVRTEKHLWKFASP